MPVMRAFTGTLNPGETQYWWCAIGYPNNNPDIYVDWLVRPVHPPGHETHRDHIVELVRQQVERTPGGPLYFLDIRSTGTHFTEFECLAFYTNI